MTEMTDKAAVELEKATDGIDHGGQAGGEGGGMARYPHRRHLWVALLLSLNMPGWGQVYCGKIGRGLVFIFISAISLPISLVGLVRYATIGTGLLTASLLPLVAIWAVAAIDTWVLALRTRPDYELKDYNRQYVYVLLMLLGTGSCVAYSLYVRSAYLQPFYSPMNSCYPTVIQGDRVLANKTAYDGHEPQRGDVVVFRRPDDRRVSGLKRVVALSGDTVEMKDGQLYVNGVRCERQEVATRAIRSPGGEVSGKVYQESNGPTSYPIFVSGDEKGGDQNFPPLKVPRYNCFVLSDNRSLANDSRQFGPIAAAGIIGRVDYLYWPADSWSRFGRLTHGGEESH